ncbi:MAG: MerR family transcriptional regulator [Dehalococcoidia bacterium]|nr:MerR family transcriptional regulator [Dehalococcoidia bacterium]
MPSNKLWSTSQFAKFARISRFRLIDYDEFGLLSPVKRGENNYRYYQSSQLAVVNLIRTLQRLGITLEEIKKLKDSRTPESTVDFIAQQMAEVNKKVEYWVAARKFLQNIQKPIVEALSVNEKEITIEFKPAEAIILGDLNDYSRGRDDFDALSDFYYAMLKKYPGIDMNYAVWGRFSENRIKNGDWKWPDRFYFYNPEGFDQKPAALYAIGYKRGGYGQHADLYERLTSYIDTYGFEICGDAYEEYPLNEVCIADEYNYLMRVMITVQKKQPEGTQPKPVLSTPLPQRLGRLNRR